MGRTINIGIIGDYDSNLISHPATNAAIEHAGDHLGVKVNVDWIPTLSLLMAAGRGKIEEFDGLWASSGSPYRSMEGALGGIRFAREQNRPLFGTWGGFQHILLEYARNVAGIKDAGHTEYDPDASVPLLVLASCPIPDRPIGTPRLWGKMKISVSPDSLAFRSYQQSEVDEPFTCNYELNPAFRGKLEAVGLKVSGVSEDGGARIIELPDNYFFLATGFVPQLTSEEAKPHPLIVAYLKAVVEYEKSY